MGTRKYSDPGVGAADQDGFHVGLGRREQRVRRGEQVPGGQVQGALGGPRRGRVERVRLAAARAAQEEGQADRDLEAVPLRGGQFPGRVGQVAVRHPAIPPAARLGVSEQQVAGTAGAAEAGVVQVRYMAVLGRRYPRRTSRSAPAAGHRPAAARPGPGWARIPRTGPAGWETGGRSGRGRGGRGPGNEPAQAGAAAHARIVSGSATRTPWLSASSGSGSRCRAASPSRDLPASRTLYAAAQAGQVRTSRSSFPSASEEPHPAQASR